MVDVIGRAKVIVTGDVDSASIDAAGGKIGSSLKKAALVGVAAVGTIAAASIPLIQSFEEAEAQSRKLANVLGNMGQSGAVEGVENLADSLMRLTGVDDEVIKGGQTILATFSAVAESAGKTGGTFERATRASLDMSAVFGSVEGAARVLGKALSDPEKAAALLRRSNVVLTEEQQKLIDAFLATGDAAGAQDVILDALEGRYKGTAEVAATESEKIKSAIGEIKESLGGIVVDLFTEDDVENTVKFSDALFKLNEELTKFQESESFPAIEAAVSGIGNLFELVGEGIGLFIETMVEAGEGFRDLQQDLDDGWEAAKIGVQEDIDSIVQFVKDAPGKIADQAGEWADAGAELIGGFIDGLQSKFSDFKTILNNALGLPRTITIGDGPGGIIPDKSFTIKAFADGVRNFEGGLAVVGERGPELVNLPAGSDVYSNEESRGMGGHVFNITTTGDTRDLVSELDWWAKYGSGVSSHA